MFVLGKMIGDPATIVDADMNPLAVNCVSYGPIHAAYIALAGRVPRTAAEVQVTRAYRDAPINTTAEILALSDYILQPIPPSPLVLGGTPAGTPAAGTPAAGTPAAQAQQQAAAQAQQQAAAQAQQQAAAAAQAAAQAQQQAAARAAAQAAAQAQQQAAAQAQQQVCCIQYGSIVFSDRPLW